MIVKTEGLVLKGMKYGDTSRIVSVLSPDFGKFSLLAKGARGPRNRFGSSLDSMNHVQVVLYKKEGRDLHLLSQCDTIQRFGFVAGDLHRLECAMTVLELVHAVSHPDEDSGALFLSAVNALEAMNQSWSSPLPVLLHFEIHLLEILGFRPELRRCSGCGSPLSFNGTNSEVFRLIPGGILCGACWPGRAAGETIHPDSLRVLQTLQGTDRSEEAARESLSEPLFRETRGVLFSYLKSHVEGMKNLKSEGVFSTIC